MLVIVRVFKAFVIAIINGHLSQGNYQAGKQNVNRDEIMSFSNKIDINAKTGINISSIQSFVM